MKRLNSEVTERDFRKPEFLDAKPEDYEKRGDGVVVRKDRWEMGIRSICCAVEISCREFEIKDVVDAVEKLAAEQLGWFRLDSLDEDDYPTNGRNVSVRLDDGSVLKNVIFCSEPKFTWKWRDADYTGQVVEWRPMPKLA